MTALATVELARPRHERHRRLNDEQQRSLADLYRSNASAVYFVCQFLLRNPEDAADAAQEVFLRAAESLRARPTAGAARSWLLAAAQSYCGDVLRRHHRVESIATNAGTDSAGEADPELAVVERDLVSAVFRELRLRERHALWQWAVECRPLAEIARDLGLSYTAVQQLLFRARRHAASVAAKVAALLGFFQAGRAVRRASHAYQLLLVAAVVPVVLASTPSSSAGQHVAGPPSSHAVSPARAPVTSGHGLAGPASGLPLEAASGGSVIVSGIPAALPAVPLHGVTSTIDSVRSTLARQTRQLSGTVGTAPGIQTPTPPHVVGGL